MAVFIKLFGLVCWELLFGVACGVAFGVLLATWYRLNRQRKDERRQLVGRRAAHPLPLPLSKRSPWPRP